MNVILITTDQQRYDSININGSSFMHTPNLDRIGKEGAVFSRAYCPTTVCTPSRVSMMTGMHLSKHGAYNIGSNPGSYELFLSTILRQHGYKTHHIGKAHWHPWGAPSPETMPVNSSGSDFTDFSGFETARLSVGHADYGIKSHYAKWIVEKGFDPKSFKVHRLFDKDPFGTGDWDLPAELHSGSWLVHETNRFLEQHDHQTPFFLNIGFQDPHHPHILPNDFKNRVNPNDIPPYDFRIEDESNFAEHIPHFHRGTLRESRFQGHYNMAGNIGNMSWIDYFQNPDKARATRSYYYSMVQLIDEQVGGILDALDKFGYQDDTLIIFTSDHGEMLGDHGIGQKGPLIYDGVTRIPLLMRFPKEFSPCQIEDCVSLVDLLPTILDFVGIAIETPRDGRSLKNRLQHGESLDRVGVRIEYKEEPDRIRYKCWVNQEWKLGIYLGESFGELYHLSDDPKEKHNLFFDSAYDSVKVKLMSELLNDMERSEPIYERKSRA
jgi:arylsulfatase A-like enzyme